jgi:serine/threonine protein kinase
MKTCPVCDTDYSDERATCPTDGAALIASSHELAPGSLVRGKYRIVRKLGQGGMGVVYLAEDILLNVNVALKFLAGDLGKDPKFIKRFRTEARTAYQLRHPNIVEVTNLDQVEDGTLFIAMEFVQGPSLRTVLEQSHGPLSIPRSLAIARDIASGLTAAHGLGTVHRDIKPENVLLASASGGRERPKILDFGIVAVAESVSRTSLTRGLLLTPNYAAPEQWMEMPAGEMDGRTDLYALGGVLYEMLTGATPFHAHNISGWMKQHLQETPMAPSQVHPDVAKWPELDALVLRLLAKDREQRPRDAGELLSLLDAVRGVPAETSRSAYPGGWELAETAAQVNVQSNPAADQTQALPAPPAAAVEQKVAPTPAPRAISEQGIARPSAIPQQIQPPPPPEQIAEAKSKAGAFPPWAWAVLAIVALIAAFAAWRLLAPHPQPRQEQAPVAQPSSQPEQAADQEPEQASNPTPANQSSEEPGQSKPPQLENPKPSASKPAGAEQSKLTSAEKPSAVPQSDATVQPQPAATQSATPTAPGIAEQPKPAPPNLTPPTQLEIKSPTPPDIKSPTPPEIKPPLANVSIAEVERQAEAFDQQKNYAAAAPLYDQACAGGNPVACRQLARMFTLGLGVARDDSRAVTLYTKACDAGNAEGCMNLGVRYMNGRGVAKDDAQATTLFTKACDAGNADGCTNLGTMNEHGVGVAKDDARAVTLYSKACDAGSAIGCGNLGKLYVRVHGNAVDVSRALPLISKGCDAGNLDSCNSLGTILDDGYYVPKDAVRALALFSKACDGGNAPGCANLGNYYRLGPILHRDPAKAREFLGKSCGMGFQQACIDLRAVR